MGVALTAPTTDRPASKFRHALPDYQQARAASLGSGSPFCVLGPLWLGFLDSGCRVLPRESWVPNLKSVWVKVVEPRAVCWVSLQQSLAGDGSGVFSSAAEEDPEEPPLLLSGGWW